MEQELKVLLYRCYMLAFNAGCNSGSVYSAEDSWEHNKYFFEDDIKRFDQNTRTDVWISVEDRLPENDGTVLVASTCGNVFTGWWDEHWRVIETFSEVTHWMPLPKPPSHS